jgi:hypothetical protein
MRPDGTGPDPVQRERVIEEPAWSCDNFLYGFKGAPSARRA